MILLAAALFIGGSIQARKELLKLREDVDGVDDELHEIERSLTAEKGSWRDLRAPAVKAALVVGVGLAILQQVTGINTVIYYAPTIIQDTGIDSDSAAILASIGVGVVNVLATVLALWLISRYGRRPLLVVGVTGMVIALVLLGLAAGLGTMANWASNFAISLTFLPLLNWLGSAPTFWLYAAVGVFTIFFCLRFVPETKGKQLEEIEAIFKQRVGESA